jgi:hypothetical protein
MVTPYYRTYGPDNHLVCGEEPDFYYTPYNIFCIETQIQPFLRSKIGRNVIVTFETINYNHRRQLIVVPRVGGEPIYPITYNTYEGNDIYQPDKEFQDEIDRITSTEMRNYCLLFHIDFPLYTENAIQIPTFWLRDIYPYLTIPDEVYPYRYNNGIYINLLQYKNFKEVYNHIFDNILRQIQHMYRHGYITRASSLVESWDLVQIGQDLYRPRWFDLRFGDIALLLHRMLMHSEGYVRIHIRPTLPRYRVITEYLESIGISYRLPDNLLDGYVDIYITSKEGIRKLWTIARHIERLCSTVVGYIGDI